MGESTRIPSFTSLLIGFALLTMQTIAVEASPRSEVMEAALVSGKPFSETPAREVAFVLAPGSSGHNAQADGLIQQVQGSISVTPNTVDTGASNTVTITTSGFFDLSQVSPSQIQVRPADGISNLAIGEQSAQHLVLSFDVADTASLGIRTLSISNNTGGPPVALDLTLKLGKTVCNPKCVSPAFCSDNQCVVPPPPPKKCSPDCEGQSNCVNGRCVDRCSPHCTGGFICDFNDVGKLTCQHAQ